MRWNCPAEGSHQIASHLLALPDLGTHCGEMLLKLQRGGMVSEGEETGVK